MDEAVMCVCYYVNNWTESGTMVPGLTVRNFEVRSYFTPLAGKADHTTSRRSRGSRQ